MVNNYTANFLKKNNITIDYIQRKKIINNVLPSMFKKKKLSEINELFLQTFDTKKGPKSYWLLNYFDI